jgi:predicted transglutaminase-like cysteine proteinase
MFKGYWLRLKSRLKKSAAKPVKKPGIVGPKSFGYLLICLILFYSPFSSIQASITLKAEKIQRMAQNSQGAIQKRFRAWAKLIESLEHQPVDVQLDKVNSFFNQFAFQSDKSSRGVEDYWKSPQEFIIDGGGDCEDYAIIKYFTLVTLGVPTEKLRITYVTSLKLNQAHMVLSYYASPEAEPLILDSLESKILKASLRQDLKPVYSFNGDGLWLAKQRGQNTLMGKPNSLGKWDELMKRMQ